LHEHKSIRLVLIDNAELLFTSANRPTRSQLTRQLTQLAHVAERREVAIVLLATLPQLNAHPFTTTMLSVYAEVCRMVYLLAPDPQDPNSRYLFCHKNTLASPTPTLHLRPPGSPAIASTRPALLPQAYPSELSFPAYLSSDNYN
jgi:hypothetical protein